MKMKTWNGISFKCNLCKYTGFQLTTKVKELYILNYARYLLLLLQIFSQRELLQIFSQRELILIREAIFIFKFSNFKLMSIINRCFKNQIRSNSLYLLQLTRGNTFLFQRLFLHA